MTDQAKAQYYMKEWRSDWNKFIRDVLHARLDRQQQQIIESVQFNPLTAVVSGTARGKDFTTACACLAFLYLTPTFGRDENGQITLIGNTKVAMTAPTDRQVGNIMYPEIMRLYRQSKVLFGRCVGYDIRMPAYPEWFLTGFKADDNNTEAWTGFHAANVMFAVTEASGVSETIFSAIEGNLQGNSRLLIVFNANVSTGYAAKAITSERFKSFRLSSLEAENVIQKKIVIQGQVDYEWVADKVKAWCDPIQSDQINNAEGDFYWEGAWYRPNDLFRIKVLGMFPRVSEDTLIPTDWIVAANERWNKMQTEHPELIPKNAPELVGVDVAGMGRDNSILCPRIGDYVSGFEVHNACGEADHMHVVGMCQQHTRNNKTKFLIDTIGEGAGVYSRMKELNIKNVFSCKFSESAVGLSDHNRVYTFANMRAYCYWALRDWLNPKNGYDAAIPPCEKFAEEAKEIKWKFQSNGSIIIEKKEEIKKRLKRSPDYIDALANTFYPHANSGMTDAQIEEMFT